MLLPQSFYDRSTLQIAQDLLGCFLVREIDGKIFKSMIVETEAYDGPTDLASHASRGRTERNQVMFGQPGHAYVYFTYGMHYLLNIVTGPEGYPAAVLLRALEPISRFENTAPKRPCSGPAKLSKALMIDKAFNGLPVFTKKHGLWVEDRVEPIKPSQIIKTTRIGVDYAGEYKDKPWRFYLKDSRHISKP